MAIIVSSISTSDILCAFSNKYFILLFLFPVKYTHIFEEITEILIRNKT